MNNFVIIEPDDQFSSYLGRLVQFKNGYCRTFKFETYEAEGETNYIYGPDSIRASKNPWILSNRSNPNWILLKDETPVCQELAASILKLFDYQPIWTGGPS